MPLIVEDGTGLATADSYLSEAAADAYFSDHGSPAKWTAATAPDKDAALRYAATYLNAYVWVGSVFNRIQALAWPRNGAYDAEGRILDTGVPQRVKDAQCELALAHLSKSISAPLSRGGRIKAVKAGSVEVQYADGAPGVPTYPGVEDLLRGLATGKGGANVSIFRG